MREKFAIYVTTKKSVLLAPVLYFPFTGDGLERAKAKRSEYMARFLDADVELEIAR